MTKPKRVTLHWRQIIFERACSFSVTWKLASRTPVHLPRSPRKPPHCPQLPGRSSTAASIQRQCRPIHPRHKRWRRSSKALVRNLRLPTATCCRSTSFCLRQTTRSLRRTSRQPLLRHLPGMASIFIAQNARPTRIEKQQPTSSFSLPTSGMACQRDIWTSWRAR